MTIVLFDPQWIIDQLKTEVTTLKRVSGAAGMAEAVEDLKQTPAAFVVPASERPSGNNTGTMVVSQNNIVRFGVVIATQNLRDPRGEKAQADLVALRGAIMTALHGWQPNADFDPIEYGGGNLLKLDNQVLWWQDNFVTSHLLRSL